MIKVLVLLRKRDELDWTAFSRAWREEHAAIARNLPGLRRYVQNHPADPRTALFAISEFYFDDLATMQQAFESPEGRATLTDAIRFADPEHLQIMVVEEVQIV